MGRYTSSNDYVDAIIALVEVMEIESENKHIKGLKGKARSELKDIVQQIGNPDYWLIILMEARKRAVENYKNEIH